MKIGGKENQTLKPKIFFIYNQVKLKTQTQLGLARKIDPVELGFFFKKKKNHFFWREEHQKQRPTILFSSLFLLFLGNQTSRCIAHLGFSKTAEKIERSRDD